MAVIANFETVLEYIKSGHPAGVPTETVYGLAARIDSESALKEIFELKRRPLFDPLIVHLADSQDAKNWVTQWPNAAATLAKKFWPGPLTLVLPKNQKVSSLITSGLETVGLRVPAHDLTRRLIAELGIPVAAPSANLFGRTSPTTAQHVAEEFQLNPFPVLDGGACTTGIESTIVRILSEENQTVELTLLRKGMLTTVDIEAALQSQGFKVKWIAASSAVQAPGQIKHHYMPAIPLIVVSDPNAKWENVKTEIEKRFATLPDSIDGVHLVKPTLPIQNFHELQLPESPALAARALYAELRNSANDSKAQVILWRKPASASGPLWESIIERLTKAASLQI